MGHQLRADRFANPRPGLEARRFPGPPQNGPRGDYARRAHEEGKQRPRWPPFQKSGMNNPRQQGGLGLLVLLAAQVGTRFLTRSPVVHADGRVFPASENADDVLQAAIRQPLPDSAHGVHGRTAGSYVMPGDQRFDADG